MSTKKKTFTEVFRFCRFNEIFRTKCEKICHVDDLYITGKCYHFSINKLKADQVRNNGCNQLGERVINGRVDDWKRAMVTSIEIRDVITEFLKSKNDMNAYWIDFRNDDKWAETGNIIDFSICPSAGTSGVKYLNFKLNCFDNDINGETSLNFICEAV